MGNTFSEEKKRLLDLLRNIKERIEKMEEKLEVNLNEIEEKINTGIANLEREKFSIAFFGAFSDGKSTILAALTRRLDIKISPEPTTDKITEYPYGDYLIIDTPGLFSEYLMHEEKTRKYISEANVIIYTVSPTNPLKESHHSTVRWLLKDLGKTEATIFVVNKMDEVADITDEEDFKRNSQIKREVVKDTLKEIMGIDVNPQIICIAADPAGLGLEYWFVPENFDNYQKLSRINTLKEILESFIKASKDSLIIKAGISVIRDSIGRLQSQIQTELLEGLKKAEKITSNQIDDLERRLISLEKDILQQYINIKEEMLRYRDSLLIQIDSCVNLDDLRRFYIKEIGEEAHIVEEKINLIIKRYLCNIDESITAMEKQIEQSVEFHKEMNTELINSLFQVGAKFGQKIVSMSNKEIMSKLFEIRRSSDLLRKLIKFQSGGEAAKWASKWAGAIKNLGKILASLSIVADIISGVSAYLNEKKFESEKENLANEISKLFKDLLEDFTEESFKNDYFPLLKDMEDMIQHLKNDKEEKQKLISITESYLRELDMIQRDISL